MDINNHSMLDVHIVCVGKKIEKEEIASSTFIKSYT